MVEDSGFRDQVSINKGLSIFSRSDADSAVYVGYNTKEKKQKNVEWSKTQQKRHIRKMEVKILTTIIRNFTPNPKFDFTNADQQ